MANRDRISKAAGAVKDKASSGLASLNKKLRGTNPDGSIRTQAQFEKAEAQRRVDKRVANMLDRKAKGKAYLQKNLNRLTTGGSKPGTYTAKGAGSGGPSRGKSIVCTCYVSNYRIARLEKGNEDLVYLSKETFNRYTPRGISLVI